MNGDEHDYDLTRAIAERAMDYLKEYGRCPSPQNYTLLYTHTAGYDKVLSDALQSAVGEQAGLTREDADRLYSKFLSPANRVAPVQAALSSEAGNVLRLIDTAADNTDDMWFSLQVAKVQLDESEGAGDLDRIIAGLVKVSQDVARQNYVLEQQLAASKAQLDDLRDVLATIRTRQDGDGLTGLLTRSQFQRGLEKGIEKAAASGHPLCLAMFDLDDFHSCNEVHGHHVGDQILRHVASVIAKRMRRVDSVARHGGDTFAVLLPDMALDAGICVAEQARELIEAQRFIRKASGRSLGRITVSAGVAAYRGGDDARSLLTRAAAGLRAAKQAGRNRVKGETDLGGNAVVGAA